MYQRISKLRQLIINFIHLYDYQALEAWDGFVGGFRSSPNEDKRKEREKKKKKQRRGEKITYQKKKEEKFIGTTID